MRLGKLLSVGEAADEQDVTPVREETQTTAENSPAETTEPAVPVAADH